MPMATLPAKRQQSLAPCSNLFNPPFTSWTVPARISAIPSHSTHSRRLLKFIAAAERSYREEINSEKTCKDWPDK